MYLNSVFLFQGSETVSYEGVSTKEGESSQEFKSKLFLIQRCAIIYYSDVTFSNIQGFGINRSAIMSIHHIDPHIFCYKIALTLTVLVVNIGKIFHYEEEISIFQTTSLKIRLLQTKIICILIHLHFLNYH